MRPLVIMLMQMCNNWEYLVGPDKVGRMQEFRYLTERERALYVLEQLEPYLEKGEEGEE